MDSKVIFTVEEVQNRIPWLNETFKSIHGVNNDLRIMQHDIRLKASQPSSDGYSVPNNETAESDPDYQQLRNRLVELLTSITTLGIFVKDIEKGLVDFPAVIEGRDIFICWMAGETKARYWHEIDSGFAGRQPL